MKVTNLSNTRVNILFNVKVNSDDDLFTIQTMLSILGSTTQTLTATLFKTQFHNFDCQIII
jgi:hypothetical protein